MGTLGWCLAALAAPVMLGAFTRGPRSVARALEPVAITRTVTRPETRPSPTKRAKDVELASLEVSEAIARGRPLPDSSFACDSSLLTGSVASALDALAPEVDLRGRVLSRRRARRPTPQDRRARGLAR